MFSPAPLANAQQPGNRGGGPTCPPGSTPQRGQCEAIPACPTGATLQNGQCEATPTCPTGFSFQNGQCVGGDACPTGFSFENGQCVKRYTATTCNTPTHQCFVCTERNPLTGECIAEQPLSICPQGGIPTFETNQCVLSFSVELNNVCPTGSAPNSEGKCVAPATCPTGTTLNSEGKCVAPATCPTGTTFTGIFCTSKPIPHGG